MTGRELKKNPIVSGALFDFLAYLTAQPEESRVGGNQPSTTALRCLQEWATLRRLDLKDSDVMKWQERI